MSPEWGGERRILGDHVVFKRDGGGGVSRRYKYEEGIDSQYSRIIRILTIVGGDLINFIVTQPKSTDPHPTGDKK